MAAPINDIFISYRRDGGAELAQLVYKDLKKRGYRVFMDVRELRSGHFDDELRRQVGAAKDFLLLLTPNSLDRCADPGDWVRSEIALALQLKLNIVPLVKPPFRIPNPEDLPPELAELPRHNAVEYNHDKSDESLAIAASRLRSKSSWLRANRGRLLAACFGLAALFAAVGVWIGFADLGKRAEQTQLTTAEIKDTTSDILESTVAVQQDASTIKQGISELANKADEQAGAISQQLDEISIAVREQIGGGNLGPGYDKVNFHRDYQDEYLKKDGQLSSLLGEYKVKAIEAPQNAMYQYLLARLYEKSGRIDEARSFAAKGYEADPTFMWNRRMLLYTCMPEEIDMEAMLRLEAEHYEMTDGEQSDFASGDIGKAIAALSSMRERQLNDPLLHEDLSNNRLLCWHLFRVFTSEPYSPNDAFSSLIGKESESSNRLLKLKVLDVKKGTPAIDILRAGKAVRVWDENGQLQRVNVGRGVNVAGDSLRMPPIAVRLSLTSAANGVDVGDVENRSFSLFGNAMPLTSELLSLYPPLSGLKTNRLIQMVYDSDREQIDNFEGFWIVFFSLPLSWDSDKESLLGLNYQVGYGFDKNYNRDYIKVSDGIDVSSVDSQNQATPRTDFVNFEKNFREASERPRSQLQSNGYQIGTPFAAKVSSTMMKEIGGVRLHAYDLGNRGIRLLFDPTNTFYGDKMTASAENQPSSEVSEFVDNLTEGEWLQVTGTVVDKDGGELLLVPDSASPVAVKMLEY
jgi:tetratricopeptide (TPR) repeat protein